jgi:DeoR/GlpR family transcriptional regulator of sugar metabolism
MNERQKKILEILKEKGKIQVGQIKEFFPNVSKRTLRRDFQSLVKKGIIERIGEKNKTFYQLKNG